MAISYRPIGEEEIPRFRACFISVFGGEVDADGNEAFRAIAPAPRTMCAFDGEEIVGTCGTMPFSVTVPGGELPMGGTTAIAVQSSHRRQGILREMMTRHLDEIAANGEPLAGLWASESSIYGRFGYGLAAEGHAVKVDSRTVHFPHATGSLPVRMLTVDAARGVVPAVYEHLRPSRPGMLSRHDAWWTNRIFRDPEHRRLGAGPYRYVVHETAGVPDGYAIYRQKERWDDFPDGTIRVVELIATSPDVHTNLWRFLTQVDLFPNVEYWNTPVDDVLSWRITDPRRIRRTLGDTLWLRILDVPRALTGRHYAAPGRLVLGVDDDFRPATTGTYTLTADNTVECTRSADTPELRLSIATLGAIYLGGHRPSKLAAAGLIEGADETLALADRMFGWRVAPWCPEIF